MLAYNGMQRMSSYCLSIAQLKALHDSQLRHVAQGNSCVERLRECLEVIAGPCLCILPSAATTFRRVQRLYFLNEGQDLSG